MKNLTKDEMKEIKAMSNSLKPQFNIGKGGVTESVIENIAKYLEAHSIVKVKVLAPLNKEQVSEIAENLVKAIPETFIVEKKGFTFTVYMCWK